MEKRITWRRMFLVALALIVIFWALNNIALLQNALSTLLNVISPFLIGFAMFFVLNISVKFIEKHLLKLNKGKRIPGLRLLSVIASLIFYGLVISFLVFLVLPDIQETVSYFISAVPEQIDNTVNWIMELIDNNPQFVEMLQDMNIDWENWQSEAINYVRTFATNLFGSLANYIPSLIGSVIDLSVSIIFALFVLFTKESLVRHVKKIVYAIADLKWANFIINLGGYTNNIFSGFVSGQLLTGFFIGVLVYIIMIILGFPYSLSISVITGVTSLIPFYGPIIGGVLGVLLISVVNFSQALWFAVMILVVQQFEGNILYPKVMGDSIGLPGIWVMVTVTIGGALFGVAGMFLSVPIASILFQFLSENVNDRLEDSGITVEHTTRNVKEDTLNKSIK